MVKMVRFALVALFLLSMASAQNIPAIDVFGGYSFLSFNVPTSPSGLTVPERLDMQGWNVAVSVGLVNHVAFEADISRHTLSDCGGTTGLNCKNFSYMFGPRYNLGDRSQKITGFVHALVGRDDATLPLATVATEDTVFAFAGGGGVTYWFARRIGVQGGADYFYTHHLDTQGVPSQNNFLASAGIVFRFGGTLPENHPKQATSLPEAAPEAKHHWPGRSHPEAQPTAAPPPTGMANVPGRGLKIFSLGAVVAPQEFDGAKVVDISSGGVAEMASLKAGDLIKSVDGKAVRTPMELAAELSDKSGKVHLGIQRGDFQTEMVILLGTR